MQFKSPEDFHHKISFIFHALLALPLSAFVYLFLELKHRELEPVLNNDGNATFIIGALLVFGLADVVAGYYLFKKHMEDSSKQHGLPAKLSAYFRSALLFYAMLELGSIIMVAGLYLTTSSFFIVGYLFLLLLLSLNRPTPQKYVKDLRLREEERDIILHKKPFNASE